MEEVIDSHILINPALAVVALWRVNQWVEDLSLSLFLPVPFDYCNFSSEINKSLKNHGTTLMTF